MSRDEVTTMINALHIAHDVQSDPAAVSPAWAATRPGCSPPASASASTAPAPPLRGRSNALRGLPCVGNPPLDGLSVSRLRNAIELHHARSRCNAQLASDIGWRLDETDTLRSLPNRKAEILSKRGDVGNGITIGQAGEMAQ